MLIALVQFWLQSNWSATKVKGTIAKSLVRIVGIVFDTLIFLAETDHPIVIRDVAMVIIIIDATNFFKRNIS
jgi:hypothetical protein